MNLFLYEKWYPNTKVLPEGFFSELKTWLIHFQSAFDSNLKCHSLRIFAGCGKEAEPDGSIVIFREFEGGGDTAELTRTILNLAISSLKAFKEKKEVEVKIIGDGHIVFLPLRRDLWFDFNQEKRQNEKQNGVFLPRFLEYEIWKVHHAAKREEYDQMIETWFRYVVKEKDRLFKEWTSGSYFVQLKEDGTPSEVKVMLFEYDCLEGHHAYKSRKLHSYAINDGEYAQYCANDPYQFFDLSTVRIDCWSETIKTEKSQTRYCVQSEIKDKKIIN